jgi:hypothetical protein
MWIGTMTAVGRRFMKTFACRKFAGIETGIAIV